MYSRSLGSDDSQRVTHAPLRVTACDASCRVWDCCTSR